LGEVRQRVEVVRHADGHIGLCPIDATAPDAALRRDGSQLLAILPALYPEWLGDRTFALVHGVRFPYVAGEMATGIASAAMVVAMGRAQMLGFFGAAGLDLPAVERGLSEIVRELGDSGAAWGANLIHSPNEPDTESAVTDLFLQRGVRRVSASAFMALTPNVVRYACRGLREQPDGSIARTNFLFAKVSRPEVARAFMSPPPAAVLQKLVSQQQLSESEARLAAHLPLAEDVTVESDSGGHTDNRPLGALLPLIAALRDELTAQHRYSRPIRIGAAGGIGTPAATASAFALGSAYVMTGSVNQATVEAGTAPACKALLCEAQLTDVIMAPAADMFELGVKVQVLRRGTLFGPRAARLYEVYRSCDSIAAIPAPLRAQLEADIFRASLDTIWAQTRDYWARRDPREVQRAEQEPKHQLALVCRWYLGNASRWALAGTPERRTDFQIWCGPAMGAFNSWVKGSFLEPLANRGVVQIALNLLEGAAVITRAQQLRSYGVAVPPSAFTFRPRKLA
jgi:PfaD family protein